MSLAVGEVFAGYTIVRRLGAGGMGSVYLAQHPRLPRQDALKVLTPELTADPQYRARFLREADVVASLFHPNILGVHDRGEYDGQLWIAMDYVAGTDAATLVREHYPSGMPPSEALDILIPVASALDYAHQHGLLHRDVKPANILLTEPGSGERWVFLADFGIARRVDDTAGLTATNMAVGTVAYAAPEQLMGQPVDARADQYALACTAFQLLTGAHPYDYSSAAVVITKHVMAPPPSIGEKRHELTHLDPAFAKAMAKKPDDRFASCQEFTQELRRTLTPQPTTLEDTQLASGNLEATQFAPAHAVQPAPINVQDTQLAPTGPVPVRPPPPAPWPTSAPKRRGWRPGVVIPAVVAIALLAAGGFFVGVKLSQRSDTTPPPAPGPAPNTGPFTGVYRADFGPEVDLAGEPLDGGATTTGTYDLRSVCQPTGCVATANRKNGPTLQPTLVFDEVGQSWLSVTATPSAPTSLDSLAPGFRKNCPPGATVTGEIWEVFSLQLRPNGTLAGEYTARSTNVCDTMRTVTFTRVADVDVNSVPDPTDLPPRVVSPAEALRGRYHHTISLRFDTGQTSNEQDDYVVSTDCLRTGERCMSFLYTDKGGHPLVFADRVWTLRYEYDSSCPSGGSYHLTASGTYPLPQPLQDPITLLTGHGRLERSAGRLAVASTSTTNSSGPATDVCHWSRFAHVPRLQSRRSAMHLASPWQMTWSRCSCRYWVTTGQIPCCTTSLRDTVAKNGPPGIRHQPATQDTAVHSEQSTTSRSRYEQAFGV